MATNRRIEGFENFSESTFVIFLCHNWKKINVLYVNVYFVNKLPWFIWYFKHRSFKFKNNSQIFTYFALTSKKTADSNSNTLESCHSIPSCSVFRSIQFSGCPGKSPPHDSPPLNVNGDFLHRCPKLVLCIVYLPTCMRTQWYF